ncbi:Uroporphyrinogen decarboxylase 1 [Forsythia ovata]|uniref:Uroporphyrinogen decarboxylase 1 n=1 Tax=Forsythia ovata TaxID=205694 RepID=A0ABD1S6Y3_9LAMI
MSSSLGFVGAPWTIVAYIVEGGTTRTYTTLKSMYNNLLRALLSHLAKAIAEYIIFQVDSRAHSIQIFDSWGGQLPPDMWECWSKPYIDEVTQIYIVLLGNYFLSQPCIRVIVLRPFPRCFGNHRCRVSGTGELNGVVECAEPKGHILNLSHGVLVRTPEEVVAHFYNVARSLKFDTQVDMLCGWSIQFGGLKPEILVCCKIRE